MSRTQAALRGLPDQRPLQVAGEDDLRYDRRHIYPHRQA
jgi:hypothetical protein